MENEVRHRVESSPGFRMARWTLPWIVLTLVLVTVLSFAGRFRQASSGDGGVTTSTIDASSTTVATQTPAGTAHMPNTGSAQVPTPAKPGSVTIAQALVEGILLRKDPSASAEVLDRLANGTKMTVIEQTDSWLKIRDPKGQVGWIRNNDNLISLKTQ